MKVIGITGQIGSGKSTLINHLKSLGYKCLVEDEIARSIKLRKDVKENLKKHFGANSTDKDILEMCLKDFNHLIYLNNLIHPLVYDEVKNIINSFKDKEPFVFVESALPSEAKFDEFCDLVIIVDCDYETRLSRVMQSRNISQKDFDLLDSRQVDVISNFVKNNESICHYVENSETLSDMFLKINSILNL